MTTVLGFRDLLGAANDACALDMLERSTGLIGVYDENEYLRFSNRAFREAYFISPGEQLNWTTLMRRNFHARRGTIIQTDDIDAWLSSVRSRRGKTPTRSYESDLHDGRWIWVMETVRDDGWIIYCGTDVTPLNASERQLRHAHARALRENQTDDLTGVSSRKHIMDLLGTMAQSATDSGTRSGFACLLDLDHFKAINDELGHSVGDETLVAFAHCVRKTIRLRDGFGRVGGEEFLLLLPDTTRAECTEVLDNLLTTIRACKPVPGHPDRSVTFSAGVCAIDPGSSSSGLFARADKALYRAKTEGRNRIVMQTGTA